MPDGWEEHIDKRGTPCAYCEAPSTRTLVIEPDQFSANELKRRGKRVGLCDDCEVEVTEDVATAVSFRRRKDKEVEQLSIELHDTRRERKGNAIYGNER